MSLCSLAFFLSSSLSLSLSVFLSISFLSLSLYICLCSRSPYYIFPVGRKLKQLEEIEEETLLTVPLWCSGRFLDSTNLLALTDIFGSGAG